MPRDPSNMEPDCTLACENGHLTAHKPILCSHNVKILVNYMYTGELVFTQDSSPASLSRAAQILKIDSLTDLDEDEMVEPLESDVEELEDEVSDVDEPITTHHLQRQLNNRNRNINNNNHHNNNNNNHHHHHQQQLPPPTLEDYHMDSSSNQSIKSSLDTSFGSTSNHNSNHLNSDAKSAAKLANAQLNSNNVIRCRLCNIGLSDVKCLYRHVLTRHLPEKWGYKCEFCEREFSRDDHLMRHYTTKHKNMEFNREKIRETRRLNREMAKNFHDQISISINT